MATGEANRTPCWFCRLPIDYQFTKQYPLHRLAGTAHHIVGLAQGGDPVDQRNLAPAHRSCNCRDGALVVQARQRSVRLVVSRQW